MLLEGVEDCVVPVGIWNDCRAQLHGHSLKQRRASEDEPEEIDLIVVSSEPLDSHFREADQGDSFISPDTVRLLAVAPPTSEASVFHVGLEKEKNVAVQWIYCLH